MSVVSPQAMRRGCRASGARINSSMKAAAASVSAPYATNSPWGMKITRVMVNTSTSDKASIA